MLWLTCPAAAYAAGAGSTPRWRAPARRAAAKNVTLRPGEHRITPLRVASNGCWWRRWRGGGGRRGAVVAGVGRSALHALAAAQQLGAHVVCADLWFYYTHRLLHTVPALYRGLHAVHHRETYPTALNALDAHPIEHLAANVGSAVAGTALLAATGAPQFYAVFVGWVALATWSTCAAHSGLKPWCPLVGTSEYHDLHHRMHTCNYGQGTC